MNLRDKVFHFDHGHGVIVQRNKTSGEVTVMFESIRGSICFRKFQFDDLSLKKVD